MTHFSSHKICFDTVWTTDRPWLIKVVQTDEDGVSNVSLMSTICRNNSVNGANGSSALSKTGYRTLRLDKVKEHDKSAQHREATQTALAAKETETSTRNAFTVNELATTQGAFEVLHYLFVNNHPLSSFQTQIQLCKDRLGVNSQILKR